MEKTILITGSSSGIGLACALDLKEKGFRVFATARKSADVDKLITLGLESVRLDVDDSSSIQAALAEILQRTNQQLYGVFNNAGFIQPGAIEDLSRAMMRAQFETNVFGAMELTRQILPIMRKQGYGRIIQNSSILGVVTIPFYGAYNASKYALEGFSSTLRQELRGTGIYVSIINPGPIESQLRKHALDIYQTTVRNQRSPHYEQAYQHLETYYMTNQDTYFMKKPDAVVNAVYRALTSKRPKAHYFVTFPAHVLAILRRILPDSSLDWLLTKAR